jgi:hypothetical protein
LQKDLAKKLALKEQQIQRYEASLYALASLTRLLEVARVLKIHFDGGGGVGVGGLSKLETLATTFNPTC